MALDERGERPVEVTPIEVMVPISLIGDRNPSDSGVPVRPHGPAPEGMMELSEMYHVGIVVSDLGTAMTHFTELLGVEWGPVVESMVEVRDGEGHDLVLPSRICYSTRAPYLELIQEVTGSPWVCNEHSNLHHIGFYAGDLAAESKRLSTAACPLELMDGHGAARPELFTYHRDPLGVRIEFVNAALRDGMEAFLCRPPAS